VAAAVLALLLANAVLSSPAAGWGDRTHPALSHLALETLPAGAADYFRRHAAALARRSMDPDTVMRGREGRDEEIRHFINLDAHMASPFTDFPRFYGEAVARFGKQDVDRNGVLPWVILRFQRQLREAIRSGSPDRAIRQAAYLGHYVGDSFQPLHLTRNYDGQLSGSQGIHRRFENGVVDARIEAHITAARRKVQPAALVGDTRSQVFTALFHSYEGVRVVLRADARARRDAAVDSAAYYARMGELLDPLVRRQLAAAASMLGSLWLTAWTEAGGK